MTPKPPSMPPGSVVKLRQPTSSLRRLGFKTGDLFEVVDEMVYAIDPTRGRVRVRDPHSGHTTTLSKWWFIPVTPLELLARAAE